MASIKSVKVSASRSMFVLPAARKIPSLRCSAPGFADAGFSRSELAREKMWSRIHLIPLLQAEEDRDLVRRYYADRGREKELLGKETDVYHSDRYVSLHVKPMESSSSKTKIMVDLFDRLSLSHRRRL